VGERLFGEDRQARRACSRDLRVPSSGGSAEECHVGIHLARYVIQRGTTDCFGRIPGNRSQPIPIGLDKADDSTIGMLVEHLPPYA
ncbi:MAG: hypothetical protein P8L45_09985, partial [Longimicrobiales bacterium]|nr:hypothetical protein [Longimicrobiales bacterium]